jgi:hypothetical protein
MSSDPPRQLHPDFSVVETHWEQRLRELGLSPVRTDNGIDTGLSRLVLRRFEGQVAEFCLDERIGPEFVASLETVALVEHAEAGKFEVRDLVTQRGPTMEQALRNCADTFMSITFPPLHSLMVGEAQKPRAYNLSLTSITEGVGKPIQWKGYVSDKQLLNDPEGAVAERLRKMPPFALMFDTLVGTLAEARVHWCKIYGAHHSATDKTTFGCSIDGHKSPEAETEMAEKFGEPIAGDWEFRQFLIAHPIGEATGEVASDLRRRFEKEVPAKKKSSLWSRLFGR